MHVEAQTKDSFIAGSVNHTHHTTRRGQTFECSSLLQLLHQCLVEEEGSAALHWSTQGTTHNTNTALRSPKIHNNKNNNKQH